MLSRDSQPQPGYRGRSGMGLGEACPQRMMARRNLEPNQALCDHVGPERQDAASPRHYWSADYKLPEAVAIT
jgi:hypothetical protein